MMDKSFNQIKNERINEIGYCELCGRKYGLELHHIVPRCIGGEDREDNLILICSICHSRLTPKSVLIRLGKDREKGINYFSQYLRKRFYEIAEDRFNEGQHDNGLFLDAFEDLISEECIRYKETRGINFIKEKCEVEF